MSAGYEGKQQTSLDGHSSAASGSNLQDGLTYRSRLPDELPLRSLVVSVDAFPALESKLAEGVMQAIRSSDGCISSACLLIVTSQCDNTLAV